MASFVYECSQKHETVVERSVHEVAAENPECVVCGLMTVRVWGVGSVTFRGPGFAVNER